MKTSNLALRLEEFAALENETQDAGLSPQMLVIAGRDAAGNTKRWLKLGTYRIQIRDSGLRPFRVF